MAQQRKEKVVLVPCEVTRAGMPVELMFFIETAWGRFHGVSPVGYCFDSEWNRISGELPQGARVRGYVTGVTVAGEAPQGSLRVELPNGNIYAIPEDQLLSAKELTRVSFES